MQRQHGATVDETRNLLNIGHIITAGRNMNCRFDASETHKGLKNTLNALRTLRSGEARPDSPTCLISYDSYDEYD